MESRRSWVRRDGLAALAVAAVAGLSSVPAWSGPVDWTPDGYFYEAQVRELRGVSSQAALASVFQGPLTAARRARERASLPPAQRRVANPEWVRYSARFYRRRWVVPLLAAAIDPLAGTRSLALVSIVGYLAAAVAIYALLRRRFSAPASALAAAAATLVPQYRSASLEPLTDSWGVALEALCLLLGLRYLETGRRALLALWPAAMLVLAFTRDNAAVVVLALLVLAVRSRRALLLAAVAAVAAVIPSLAFGTHLKVLLAYTLDGSRIPPSTSWTWSVHHYWHGVETMLRGFATPLRHGVPPLTGLALLAGLLALLLLRRGGDGFRKLLLASLPASAVFLLSLPQEGFRIAFVVLPAAAAGYAVVAERLVGAAVRVRVWAVNSR
jgi:Dolichyl-phosphate-mannose-protein mannosyltransferase